MATNYGIEEDILDAYGLQFWLNVADENNDGIAEGTDSAFVWASGTIDSKVGLKYQLPLTVIPELLTQYAVDLAVFRRASTADRMTEEIRMRRDEAMEWLTHVSTGKVSLGLDNPPLSHVGGVFLTVSERVVTDEEWLLS